MRTIETLKTGNQLLDRALQRFASVLNPLLKSVLANAVVLEQVALTTSFADYAHGLGRIPIGWFVVDRDADARVWRDVASNNVARAKVLRLRASAAVNVVLVVF